MTLQEFIEKIKTDEALKAKVDAAILEKVILPMAEAEGVELNEEELSAISGGIDRVTIGSITYDIRFPRSETKEWSTLNFI